MSAALHRRSRGIGWWLEVVVAAGVQRYSPCEEDGVDHGFSEMRKDPDGGWVRLADFAAARKRWERAERQTEIVKQAWADDSKKRIADYTPILAAATVKRRELEAALEYIAAGGFVIALEPVKAARAALEQAKD